jgi:type III restriction enzyme
VPRKAMTAIEWCKAASRAKDKWDYIFIPQNIMEGLTSNQFGDLVRSCAPARQNLLSEMGREPELPLFTRNAQGGAKKAAEEALEIYRYLEKKMDATSLAPVFTVLLGSFDEAAKAFILKRLQPLVPINRLDQQRWFDSDFSIVPHRELRHFQNMAASLKRALVYGSVHSSIGLTRSCLDHAVHGTPALSGVFAADTKSVRNAGRRWPFQADQRCERISEYVRRTPREAAHRAITHRAKPQGMD